MESELRDGLAYVEAELRAIDEAAGDGPLDEDTQARFDEGVAYVTDTRAQLDQIESRRQAIVALASEPHSSEITVPNVQSPRDPFDLSDLRFGASDDELRGRALTAIERTERTESAVAEHATRAVERLGAPVAARVLGTGTTDYRHAFGKVISGRAELLSTDERQALERAQSLTDAAGGFAVPFTLDPTIILTNAGTVNPLRRIANVKQITTDAWNGVTSAGATATYKAEAAEATDDAITLAQPNIPVHRLDVFIPFSVEVGGDWAGIESDLRMVMNDAKERAEATAMTTGSGTNQPTGFVTALDGTSAELNPATTETFATEDIFLTEENLGDRFKPNARWAANRAIYNDIRQFGDADGFALWERLGAGLPPELIGYPAEVVSDMDDGFDAAATADNFILCLGDWMNFVIVDRVGMNVELVPHLFATGNNRPSGQRGFWAWCRNGSDVVTPDGEGFSLLNVATTA